MKPPDDDRLLDVREAPTILGLKPSTLYQWAYERRIPVVKLLGRALRFRLSTIQKLIADSERPALRSLDDRSNKLA
jgi:excisionase family DNA binding protein